MFAHPELLIWASCSMVVAQGTWSAVWRCVGWKRAMTVAWSRKTEVEGMAQG